MPRIVSVWLEHWPITRLRRARGGAQAISEAGMPLVLAAAGSGGLRLTAVDAAAATLGLRPGEPLARARARIGSGILVHPADRRADAAALERLCLWVRRYTPVVMPFGEAEGEDGLFLDIAGASHLFGGEAGLVADLERRLAANAVPARLALADTLGAAFALARHGHRPDGRRPEPRIVAPGATSGAVSDLSVAALRLDPAVAQGLRRLGLCRIGALTAAPRAPLARRFGEAVLRRLDQVLGLRPEPLTPLGEAAGFSAMRGFLEPIGRQDAIVATATRLMEALGPRLAAADLGARALRLTLNRVDGAHRVLELGLSEPTRCAIQVARLLDLRLERLGPGLDAGFGFEAVRLDVTEIGSMTPHQAALPEAGSLADARASGHLVDALRQRLGRRPIRLEPRRSHIPERAEMVAPWRAKVAQAWPIGPERADEAPALPSRPRRPLVLLRRSEPAQEVLVVAPGGPPWRFRWRSRLHTITHTEGPERIAPEWWRETAPTRDYYLVEDEAGRRLWLYQEGLPTPPAAARWFVHGLFA